MLVAVMPLVTPLHAQRRYQETPTRMAFPSTGMPSYYITSMMWKGRGGSWQRWDDGDLLRESIALRPPAPLRPGTLHGTLLLQSFEPGFRYMEPLRSRVVRIAFAATFDPRVDSVPRTMTAALASRLMTDALQEFSARWTKGGAYLPATDSTKDDAKAREYLTSRWWEIAVVDSVVATPNQFYVAMRGRYAPVACFATHASSIPSCAELEPRRWSRAPVQPRLLGTPPPRAPSAAAGLPEGAFRGMFAFKEDARDRRDAPRVPVVGTASWRLELDSLDWRRKVTLRLTLATPESTVIILRTAGTGTPRGTLTPKNIPSSHVDPRYYTASMWVREAQAWRLWNDHDIINDKLVLDSVAEAGPTVLRGTMHLRSFEANAHEAPRKIRFLQGAFAARFDPRPEPVLTAMTSELATRIMTAALYDFAVGWMDGMVNPSPADSTKDDAKARAYLTSRWGEAAIIDSVAVGPKVFFVGMRARYALVACIVSQDSNRPTCTAPPRRDPSHPIE